MKNKETVSCLQRLCKYWLGRISNSFNLKLQLKDTESAIKNELIDLLSTLRGFKFVTTLVLEFIYT